MSASGERPRIAALVLTYKRPESLRRCLRTLADGELAPDAVLLVDNGGDPASREILASAFPTASLETPPGNVGAAGACARGMRRALDELAFDWLWISDDDMYARPDTLRRLAAYLAERRDTEPLGIVSPVQISRSGNRIGGQRVRRYHPTAVAVPETGAIEVDLVQGSGMLVSRHVLETVGTYREDFFHSFVDYEFCLRVREAGFRIEVLGDSLVDHHYGEPVERTRWGRRTLRPGYPAWKYYYHVRNGLFTWLRVARQPVGALRFLLGEGRALAGDLVYGDDFFARQAMRARGLLDGLRGRLGPRVRPGTG